ncbi:Copia protein, partial [Mucuna pruriens]
MEAGYIFFYGGAPTWSSTKELVVALSSFEAEYIVASTIACQAVWLEVLIKELQVKILGKVKLLVDNNFAIELVRHPVTHGRSKHIETRFHFLKEQVGNKKLRIEHCKTKIQFANILTKALKFERFRCLRDSIGIICVVFWSRILFLN